MSGLLQQLFHQAHLRHLEMRRYQTCFHAFSGALIEAFRERGYRLVGFDTHSGAASAITLDLEQPDGDRLQVRLEPYRPQQAFLRSIGGVAEVFFTLRHHVQDPDVITAAQTGMLRQGLGLLLGQVSGHAQGSASPGLAEPGNLRFQLHGAEVSACINLIVNLRDYAVGSLDFDKDKLGSTLDAVVYGLEKFLAGILERHLTPGASTR